MIFEFETAVQNGIERETLRVDSHGIISQNAHPEKLGHKLTHPNITTDFSENLMEFITSVHTKSEDLYAELACIHGFTNQAIGDEYLWPLSMPAILPEDDKIPLAYYGESNVGKLKTLYRRGLGHRYGRSMQTIAGVHFNFSFKNEFWEKLLEQTEFKNIEELKNEKYFDLIRNFRRYSWVLMYLYGASPMVDKSFVHGKKHHLKSFKKDSYISDQGLSLRMGGLGYTSSAQKEINICFNHLSTYIQTVEDARLKNYPAYEKIGILKDGEYQQLNTNLLQIDNEFYSTIRPKNVAKSRESALGALYERGVEYIEVRLLDVDPFNPYGISKQQINFLNLFLSWCLQLKSKKFSQAECALIEENFSRVVNRGRDKNLKIVMNETEKLLKDELNTFLDNLSLFAEKNNFDKDVVENERTKVVDINLQPAQKIINLCEDKNIGHTELGLMLASDYKKQYKCRPQMEDYLTKMVAASLEEAAMIKSNDQLSFDDFLKKYFSDIKINYGSIS